MTVAGLLATIFNSIDIVDGNAIVSIYVEYEDDAVECLYRESLVNYIPDKKPYGNQFLSKMNIDKDSNSISVSFKWPALSKHLREENALLASAYKDKKIPAEYIDRLYVKYANKRIIKNILSTRPIEKILDEISAVE